MRLILKKITESRPWTLAFTMNAILLALCLLLNDGSFNSLDDHFMAAILTGANGGVFDPHLYFVNSAYAYFLKPFYFICPKVGWYSVFEFVSVFVSFTSITYVVIKKSGLKFGFPLSVLVLTCVAPDFYFHVGFTQCAGALFAAGMLLFVLGDFEKKKRYLCAGLILALAGFVIRKEMFLLGLPTLGLMLCCNLYQNKCVWKFSLIALTIGAGLFFALKTHEANLYKVEGYDYYAAYQPVRSVFGDGDYYDTDAVKDEMEERGLKSRDYRYLRAWYFYDKDVFSLDSLKPILSLVGRNSYEPNYLKAPLALSKAIANEWLSPHLWCWLLLCVFVLVCQERKFGFVPWASLGLICLSYLYLLLVNRVAGHVVVGIWLYAVVFMVSNLECEKTDSHVPYERIILVISIVSCVGVLLTGVNIAFDKISNGTREVTAKDPDWNGFLKYAQQHREDVFMLPFGQYKELAKQTTNVFKTLEPGSWDNIVSSGYWNIHLPAIDKELEKRGVHNLFKDIVNDNVYVIEDDALLSMAPFYQDHYHKRLKVDTLRSFGSLNLLKYSVKDEE